MGDRIGEICEALGALRAELRLAQGAEIVRITDRIDALVAELMRIGHAIVAPVRRPNATRSTSLD
jgi:hypothetical protein